MLLKAIEHGCVGLLARLKGSQNHNGHVIPFFFFFLHKQIGLASMLTTATSIKPHAYAVHEHEHGHVCA